MPSPIDSFKEYFNQNEDFFNELIIVRNRIVKLLENKVFRHFTDHSVDHSDRMTELLHIILKPHLSMSTEDVKLNEDELYILLLSIYLHDLSLEYPLAHKISKNINDLTEGDLELMRKNHGEISATMLKNIIKKNDSYKTSLNLNNPNLINHIPYVCNIIKKHQSKEEYDSKLVKNLGVKELRIGLLIGLLRIVDQLDCDYRRVSMEKLHQYTIPPNSVLHWLACHYINSVNIKYGIIKIGISYPDSISGPERKSISNELIEKINYEISLCNDALWENNIILKFENKLIPESSEFTFHKMDPPTKVRKFIQDDLLKDDTDSIDIKEKKDWMSHWNFNGNPFLDNPLSYGDKFLVETKDFQTILSEINNKIKAKQGAAKLLIGERGYGKTSLFQIIKGYFDEKICPVTLVDAAEVVANINSGSELKNSVFNKTENELFGIEDIKMASKFDKDRFFERLRKKDIRIICIDSLDRLDSENNDKILRDFFTQSQQILSESKNNSIVILSCSPEWKSFIDSDDLSYLSYNNQWFLNKFNTEDAKSMISKRLSSSGRVIDDIFEEDAIFHIQTISNGNPRKILNNAERICRLAFNKGVTKITSKLINDEYEEIIEGSYTSFLDSECRKSTKFKEGLLSLHCFFSDLERRNLDINVGIDLITKLLKNNIKQKTVNIQYYTSIKIITKITIDSNEEKQENHYKLDKNLKILFDILKKQGYSSKDFLSYYSHSLYIPEDERDNLKNKFKNYLVITDDVHYYEQSRIEYNELGKTIKIGHVYLRKGWSIIENILVAILIRSGNMSAKEYEDKKSSTIIYDHLERERFIGGYEKILSDLSKDIVKRFKDMNKGKRWVNTLSSIQWIMIQRNNVLHTRSDSLHKYDKTYIEICKNHLEICFKELLELYDDTKLSKKLIKESY